MSLLDAVLAAGILPSTEAKKEDKKRYSELLSQALAQEVASGLRNVGFPNVKPFPVAPVNEHFKVDSARRRSTSATLTNNTDCNLLYRSRRLPRHPTERTSRIDSTTSALKESRFTCGFPIL